MGFDLGTIWANIGLNTAKLDAGITKSKLDINNLDKEANKRVADINAKLNKIGSGLTNVGKNLSMFVTLPLLAAGAAATKFAMDAVESENLFKVSMGNMADAARDWSIELSEALGLNQYEVRENTAVFNVMFDSMGLGEKAAYDMAKGFTQLSYDMSSFYNLKPEEAFIKLQAGITGEIEPLKRLGIVINETTVKAYAYKVGITEVGDELTEQEKIMARYGLIMEQTSKAQGDLARTIDDPANQLRKLQSQAKETAISFGMELLPAVSDILQYLNKLISTFKELSPENKKLIINLGLIAAAAGPVIFGLGKMITTFNATRNAIIGMSAAAKLASIELFAVVGFIVNAGSAIYGLTDTIKRFNDGSANWKSNWLELAYPMIPVLEKMGLFNRELNEAQKEIPSYAAAISQKTSSENINIITLKELAKSQANATDETNKSTQATDELIASLHNLYNLNQSVTEATWGYEDSLKELTDIMANANATERDKQSAIFATQDALENLQIAMIKEYEATDTSIERKKELQKQYVETGIKAVDSGAMSANAFINMASQFGVSKNDIVKFANEMGAVLDNETRQRIIRLSLDTSGFDTSLSAAVNRLNSLDRRMGMYAMGGIVGKMPGYAHGGIIGKASMGMVVPQTGRAIPILAHEGEMILNDSQQGNLINALWGVANGKGGGGMNVNLTVISQNPLTPSDIARETTNALRLYGLEAALN